MGGYDREGIMGDNYSATTLKVDSICLINCSYLDLIFVVHAGFQINEAKSDILAS